MNQQEYESGISGCLLTLAVLFCVVLAMIFL